MASKNDKGLTLAQASGIRNVFANDWKGKFFNDSKKKIASIPFLRNLIEMTTGEDDPNYQLLTAMVHWKEATPKILVGDLDQVFNTLCKTKGASKDQTKGVAALIAEEVQTCMTPGGVGLNLENKIVLAIAIRLASEQFMIGKINDAPFVANIEANQTQKLIERYKQQFPAEHEAIKVLDRVALMTPENIHVNSFMYEPIIDMSDDSLRKLRKDVVNLA
jgi:hypothetical protein